jgi:hypothetical protein
MEDDGAQHSEERRVGGHLQTEVHRLLESDGHESGDGAGAQPPALTGGLVLVEAPPARRGP